MHVAALRRHPVKSMGGESLDVADIDARGLVGDRWYAVQDDDGHLASGKNTRRFRRHDEVFDYAAATGPDGVLVRGPDATWPVGDPGLGEELSRRAGRTLRLVAESTVSHQDSGAVSVVGTASLAWCAERWGGSADPRRLRANIVLQTDEPFVEDSWVGRHVQIGSAVLSGVKRTPRCRMVDVDQDGVAVGAGWLKPLGRERDLCLAVYLDVVQPGAVRVGDRLALPEAR